MIETVKNPPSTGSAPAKKTACRPYLESFEQFEAEFAGGDPPWVQSIRKAGVSHFAELGLPTTQDEEWRFTNIAPILKLPFKPIFEPSGQRPSIAKFTIGGLKCARLVFVDGRYSAELSSPLPETGGVRTASLDSALATESGLIEQHLARHARCDDNPFVGLNTAFFQDGAFIRIPDGRIVEEPIHLLFISTGRETGATTHPRNLIIAGKNSQATVIENYVSTVDTAYFTNAVTEIVLEENAVLEHCKLQAESLSAYHIATIQAYQGRGSNWLSHSISTGAKIARNNIRTVLDAEGIECVLNGLYLGVVDQLVDHHTVVDHAKPRCNSHEFYNGILDGKSKGVFNGKIFVRKDAQKTDAKQTSRNLLLSEEATVDTKPQLEIFADDVKCTHGATVGQLNEEEIFYLRSRGIGADRARRMLIHAFASDIINRIKLEPVRDELEKLLTSRLDEQG